MTDFLITLGLLALAFITTIWAIVSHSNARDARKRSTTLLRDAQRMLRDLGSLRQPRDSHGRFVKPRMLHPEMNMTPEERSLYQARQAIAQDELRRAQQEAGFR